MSEREQTWTGPLERIDEFRWRIPRSFNPQMHADGIIYASAQMLEDIKRDRSLEQVANVACLPGLVGDSLAMPDIHYGYGFPIGGVAATDVSTGVISPGGVGYDINCGVRLLRTNLTRHDITPKIRELVNQLFADVPSGVGSKGKIRVTPRELKKVLEKGAAWAVSEGMGFPEDLENLESGGRLEGADSEIISSRAMERGQPQLGTLGAGNHFLEIQFVEEIYDQLTAAAFGITQREQVTLMIHTGSRGLGHQICDDALEVMRKSIQKYGLQLPDPQLACAPVESPEGRDYLAAMSAAANYAWANRQCITHWSREAFERIFQSSAHNLGLDIIYDVAHNVAKIEEHQVGGVTKRLCVHRKGATRAFGPGRMELSPKHRKTGQPVIVPGSMGTASYLCVGTKQALAESWGSTCHGAGRTLSRHAAIRAGRGRDIAAELQAQGVYARAAGRNALAEELPEAYKNVVEVVNICDRAGLSKMVARLRPIGVMKG